MLEYTDFITPPSLVEYPMANNEESSVPKRQPLKGLAMGFRSLFYDLEDEASPVVLAESADAPEAVSEIIITDTSGSETPIGVDRFYEEIMRDLAEDPDALTAFQDAFKVLVAVKNPDERRAAAFAVVQGQGHSKTDVLAAIQDWISRVDIEVEESREDALTEVDRRLALARSEVDSNTKEIDIRVAQIKQLQAEVEGLNSKLEKARVEVTRAERNKEAVTHALARAKDRVLADLRRLMSDINS